MRRLTRFTMAGFAILLAAGDNFAQGKLDPNMSKEEAACRALLQVPNLTIILAELVDATASTPQYCYVKGLIPPGIQYHVQLPLLANWNGRFLKWGDGGKDGDLDFANERVAQGYAVANSNTGHDSGSEPGASFGFNNRQAEIDFGYRAVHLTVNVAKTVVKTYYGRDPKYSYFEGCSTGGRQALMEAQRFPYDFDGIVAGAPVNFYQAMNASQVWLLQRFYRNHFAGNLAFDTDRDGIPDSLTKLNILKNAVLAKCDAKDGIQDGVIDDPVSCDFNPVVDLADKMCPGDVNADHCFTTAQLQTIKDSYTGGHDSKGTRIYKGNALGSEFAWPEHLIPHAGNKLLPARLGTAGDHINYLFYETDPGVTLPDLTDLSQVPDRKRNPPEYAWWEFNIDDVTAGKADFMMSIADSKDPDLRRFLIKKGGKFILYHGWGDTATHPEPTLDYYKDVVGTTFKGDMKAARDRMRLFMIPGMDHCRGGPGPNDWDKLSPLVDWVENGKAPDFVVATHSTNQKIDNERPICAYPQRAFYAGPAGGQNDPANWVRKNFVCK
ncbi:MAG: tannase/feruloyl esterase family alpha/beta hydrolase [Acidobacteria bacterium]|nr:tannase/feruloyl esterase family alpha/beta hydrolase [Acidobacteriota bacterium]